MARQAKPAYEFGPFRLDTAEHRLLRDGHPVPLTPKVLDVLRVLVENSGHLVEKDDLLKQVWPDSFVEESNINRHISILRKVLDGDATGPQYIETIPKRGYRFVAPVTEHWERSAQLVARQQTRTIIDIEQEEPGDEPKVEAVIEATNLPPPRGTTIGQAVPQTDARISRPLALAALAAGALMVLSAFVYLILKVSDQKAQLPRPAPSVHTQVTFTGKAGSPALSPDGKYLAYVSFLATGRTKYEVGMKVMVQDLAGGGPIEVFHARHWCGDLRWSPDGSELVFRADSGKMGIYLVPRLGGMSRLIAPGQWFACWSPNGSQLAVTREASRRIVFVKKLTGEEERAISLTGSFRWISDLDWSPTGNFLLFVTQDDHGRSAIWIIGADGSRQSKVLEDDLHISSAHWSPRGNLIYYLRRKGQTVDLWKIPIGADTGKPKAAASAALAGLEAGEFFGLSGDGKCLVYEREPQHSNLWLAEVTGSGQSQKIKTKELTTGTSPIERPHISPDGKSVVFAIGRHPTANLYTIPTEGGPPKQLTFFNSHNAAPVWSPDGKQIAFASTQDGSPKVWMINAEGGTPRRLSVKELANDYFYLLRPPLTWSPGANILFQRPGNRNFFILNPKTGEAKPLVNNEALGWIFTPVYSPDGGKIAVVWNRRPSRGIWVVSLKDSSQRLAYKSDSFISPIGWSADGNWIYALEERKILMISVTGLKPKTLATLPFEGIGNVSMASDGRRFVCSVYESLSDVWMVENFDPEAAFQAAPHNPAAPTQ